jgi:hypothetical protein
MAGMPIDEVSRAIGVPISGEHGGTKPGTYDFSKYRACNADHCIATIKGDRTDANKFMHALRDHFWTGVVNNGIPVMSDIGQSVHEGFLWEFHFNYEDGNRYGRIEARLIDTSSAGDPLEVYVSVEEYVR